VVSELGEGRIVRMEESGARTPLVIQVPSLCPPPTTETAAPHNHRLRNPTALLYTPFGDLLIGETHTHCETTTANDNDTVYLLQSQVFHHLHCVFGNVLSNFSFEV